MLHGPIRKRLFVLLATLLLGLVLYLGMVTLATPVSFDFQVQSGIVDGSNPDLESALAAIEREQQELFQTPTPEP